MNKRSLKSDANLQTGRLLARSGNWVDAEKAFRRAVDFTEARNARALYLLGNAQFQLGNYAKSLKSTEAAVGLDGSNPEWHIRLGSLYERLNRDDAAIQCYEFAIAKGSRNADWLKRLASAQVRNKKHQDASRTLRALLEYDDNSSEILADYVDAVLKSAPTWQRIEVLNFAIAKNSQKSTWYTALGNAYTELGQFNDAAKSYNYAHKIDKNNPEIAFKLGLSLRLAGSQIKEAKEALEAGVEVDVKFRTKELGPGAYFQSRGQWQPAAYSYQESLGENPFSAELRYRAGLACDRTYDWPSAERYLRQAVIARPEAASWHYRLGLARERQGLYESAADSYGVAVRRSDKPQQNWVYRWGFCLQKANKVELALQVFRQLFPNDDSLKWVEQSGDEHLTPYESELLRENLEYACQMQDASLLFERASALLKLGQFELALCGFETAVVRDSRQRPLGFFRLAVTYMALGRNEDAIRAFLSTSSFPRPDGITTDQYFKHKWQYESMEYVEFLETLPVRSNVVLYESYFGTKIDCNPAAIYREMRNNPKYVDFLHVWVITPGTSVPSDVANDPRVALVLRGSTLYRKYLATAKYLINNVTFPSFFTRRDGQNYLNTWHGTPLKTLGRDIQTGFMEHANVSRNFLQATHMLAPNQHTQDTLISRYEIEGLYTGTVARVGSPRLDKTLNASPESCGKLRATLGIPDDGKAVVFYAPTWRGSHREKSFDKKRLVDDLARLEALDAHVLFRAHHLTEALLYNLKLGVKVVPAEIDTYDVLAIADVLITDYSSLLFDFLATGKPMVFYAYDLDAYTQERGLYFEMESLPGALALSIDELIGCVSTALVSGVTDAEKYEVAKIEFTPMEDGKAADRAVRYFFSEAHDHRKDLIVDQKCILLIHQSLMPNGITSSFLNLLNNLDPLQFRIIFLFDSQSLINDNDRMNKFNLLPNYVQRISRIGSQLVSLEERWVIDKFNTQGEWSSGEQEDIYRKGFQREFKRIFGCSKFDSVIEFDGYAPFWVALLGAGDKLVNNRIIYMHNRMKQEWSTKYGELKNTFSLISWYDKFVSVSKTTSDLNMNELSGNFDLDSSRFVHADNLLQPNDIIEMSKDVIDADILEFIKDSDEIWLTIGRLSPEKSHLKLFTAFKEHIKIQTNAKLLLLGDGPLRQELDYFVQKNNLQKNIFIAGRRSNPFSIMTIADAFILASDHEGQPMVLLEALVMGLPTVATDIVGSRGVLGSGLGSLVENSVNGLIDGLKLGRSHQRSVEFNVDDYQATALAQFISHVQGS
ncbi:CDP-glycerol glycerophosphotransferase family protein [Paeniglutamicibacter cryotolerans]|uniref:CDP-glycerol glycerophosphotransferase n=1 Tax=Paeniglutamicibacter cryotolerans TaxID=670079 RepID=A0A839QNX4_9MICC|nr:CDP-glycerol glycerophosphotransferase family protein [Paeniglutamicibacter cryotolerans]MBB2997460.1 CDP-glycerol glycerophosphotransferase [Paeniglutamicibacter cryotolerans]